MMNDKSLLIVFRRAPYGRSLSRAGYDLALAAAAFDQAVSLLFMDDGVWQLLPGQQAEQINARNITSTLASLPLYDVERLYVDGQSLESRGLRPDVLVEQVAVLEPDAVQGLMHKHQQVLVF